MVFRAIHRFASDRRGNIATMFAVSLPVLIFGVGAALDLGRAAQVRTKMDNAAYAAAVAALAPSMAPQGEEDAKASILNMFQAQIGGVSGVAPGRTQASATIANPNGNPRIRTATLCYSTSVQTPVVGIVGASTQPISNCASATGEVLSSVASSPLQAAPVVAPWPTPTGVQVPSGCGVPATSTTAQTFYVDPVNGSASGTGTAAKPWNTLAAAISNVATAPLGTAKSLIQPGATILLRSGNYGDLVLQGYSYGYTAYHYDNGKSFITVQAAPKATPVFTSVKIWGAGGWVFRGLTVQQTRPSLPASSYGALVLIEGDNHDVIFDSNAVKSTANIGGWSQANWLANAPDGIVQNRSDPDQMRCLSITNNNLTNVSNGIVTQNGDYVIIKHNKLDYYTHHGVNYASDNLVIQYNLLTNRIDAGDGSQIHPDFMLGQPYPITSTTSNVLIDSNIAIRQTDPNLPFAAQTNPTTQTQGINAFDGHWVNVTVTNNVVITTTYNGISFSDVAGLTIANNLTVLDGAGTLMNPDIAVVLGKDGGLSTNVAVVNNLAATFNLDKNIPMTVVGNAIYQGGMFIWAEAPGYYDSTPGPLPDGNQILALHAQTLFKNLTIVNGVVTALNLNLMGGTPVVGKGTTTDAPTEYITGAQRVGRMNLGPYPVSN